MKLPPYPKAFVYACLDGKYVEPTDIELPPPGVGRYAVVLPFIPKGGYAEEVNSIINIFNSSDELVGFIAHA